MAVILLRGVAQHRELPTPALALESRMVSEEAGGPMGWVCNVMLKYMSSLGLQCKVRDLDNAARAAMLHTMVGKFSKWPTWHELVMPSNNKCINGGWVPLQANPRQTWIAILTTSLFERCRQGALNHPIRRCLLPRGWLAEVQAPWHHAS